MAQRYLLQELDVSDTGLTDTGAEHIASTLLATNVYIEALTLAHNPRVTSWGPVGDALGKNRCLRTLNLDGCRVGDAGAEGLSRGLRRNRVLRSLGLEDAGIGEEGGKNLMELLKRNTIVLELTLSPGNGALTSSLREDIEKYIALNRAPYSRHYRM